MIIRVVTLGCKVNQVESASIVAALTKIGYNASEGLEPADVYVLNTCSVTAEADRKSRQQLEKMRKLSPDCGIIVVGCSTQNNAKKFEKPNVIAIGGTYNKSEFVVNVLKDICKNNNYSILSDRILYQNAPNAGKLCEYPEEEYPIFNKTRSFIKVQDGCNRFCSYCIIPYLRGRSRSRSVDSIVGECMACKSAEIVVTGIDLSYFGKDIGETLSGLVRALKPVKMRKRLGSLECEVVDDDLLDAMRDSNFCPHFHLSLQSGSDEVLRTMNRHYDTRLFMEKVELIRKYFPLAGITTDIIVGFPTETDSLFRESLDFIRSCEFSDMHIFPYSSRAGTLASRKYAMLPGDIVAQREIELLALKKSCREKFFTKNLDTAAPVYTETACGEHNVGYTPNYIKVYSDAPCGVMTDLILTETYKDGMLGRIIK